MKRDLDSADISGTVNGVNTRTPLTIVVHANGGANAEATDGQTEPAVIVSIQFIQGLGLT